jgi:hypothetical protein
LLSLESKPHETLCEEDTTASIEGVEPMGGMNRDGVLAAFKATGLQAASVCCHAHWEKPLSAPDEATRKIGLDGLLVRGGQCLVVKAASRYNSVRNPDASPGSIVP